MFADPQFWVAVSFLLFIVAIFNPVRKILKLSLDTKIDEIKNQIKEAENIKSDAQKTLSELKSRESEVEKEIKELIFNSDQKISEIKEISSQKLSDQIEKRKIVAENKIEQLVRDANLYIKNYVTNVAIDSATNILRNNLSDEKKSELIKGSIKELNNILKN